MAAVNSVKIAQRLGAILAVDDFDNTGLICQLFLRFCVALDTSKPLIPGFHLPRPVKEPLWISFRYERLGDYCTLCGVIGHKKNQCSQPPTESLQRNRFLRKLSHCLGCAKLYLHPWTMLTLGFLQWALLSRTRMLNRALGMVLSRSSNSSLASMLLIHPSMWLRLPNPKPCSLRRQLEFGQYCPILWQILWILHSWHLPIHSLFYRLTIVPLWA